MNILLITDAWEPQVNGVVRTWQHVREELQSMGHGFRVIHPGLFRTIGAPRYPEIRLALFPRWSIRKHIESQPFDAIHIATEGPLGQAARAYCLKRRHPFTSSYHTQFPQYLHRYFRIPTAWTYAFVRRFHGKATATLVPTQGVNDELTAKGLTQVVTWSRGADTNLFKPGKNGMYETLNLPRPIFIYAGRVALEKNLDAFLTLNLPGSKVIVGDGPPRAAFEKKYPDVYFAGYQFGEELAKHYADADVFVFPSLTDTFGVVMLEANACGLPVAAFPVTGPIDVIKPGINGVLDDDLASACQRALDIDPDQCVQYARENSWRKCAQIVLDQVQAMANQPPS